MDINPIVTVAPKTYRLHNGSMGTEYEACAEVVRTLEARRRALDEQIELMRLRMETAAGAP
jgi:hypothetical protein